MSPSSYATLEIPVESKNHVVRVYLKLQWQFTFWWWTPVFFQVWSVCYCCFVTEQMFCLLSFYLVRVRSGHSCSVYSMTTPLVSFSLLCDFCSISELSYQCVVDSWLSFVSPYTEYTNCPTTTVTVCTSLCCDPVMCIICLTPTDCSNIVT